jgi:hypothetical protein
MMNSAAAYEFDSIGCGGAKKQILAGAADDAEAKVSEIN